MVEQNQNKGSPAHKGGGAKGSPKKGGQQKGGGGGAKGTPAKTNSNSKTQPKEQSKQQNPNNQNEAKQQDKHKNDQNNEESGKTAQTPRDKKKEFFREELKRLKTSLQKESEKIVEPERGEYKPFIFNNLEPYYNCYTQDYLFELPEELRHQYVSRNTALGLCDPWEDHRLDVDLLPKIDSIPVDAADQPQGSPRQQDKERPSKEGSTHLPKFPSVTQVMAMPKEQDRIIPYDQVPKLREEIKNRFSSQAGAKVDEDYKRTKEDFFRMELDKFEEIHPINRPHMRRTYCAYLQNTPGSKKALYECLKTLPKEEKKDEEEEKAKTGQEKKPAKDTKRNTQQRKGGEQKTATAKQ